MVKKISYIIILWAFFMILHITVAQNDNGEFPIILELSNSNREGLSQLDWNFNSQLLAIRRGNGFFVVNLATKQIDVVIEELPVVYSIDWNPVRNYLLVAGNRSDVWDYDTNTWLNFFLPYGNVDIAFGADWHPDGDHFAIGFLRCPIESDYNPNLRIEIWNITNFSFFQLDSCVGSYHIRWNPLGNLLALGYIYRLENDGYVDTTNVEVWDIEDRKLIKTLNFERTPKDLLWNPTGDMIALQITIDLKDYIQILNLSTGEIVSQIAVNLNISNPLAMDWHPSENWIVTGERDGFIRIWNALDGSMIKELSVYTDSTYRGFYDAHWSPDGSMLATIINTNDENNSRLLVWDTSELYADNP
jgi:WD40 repeat protein